MSEPTGLARFTRRATREAYSPSPAPKDERCELCGEAVPAGHRHLLDVRHRRLVCTCRPCSILFDRPEADQAYRLVPDRVVSLGALAIDAATWDALRIPVDVAFFFHDSAAGRTVAFYPGPAGATESLLDLPAWAALAMRAPALSVMQPDVEALLVRRQGAQASDCYVVPIDECYRLVGIIRTHWHGLSGGEEVWRELSAFFEALRGRAEAI
jgi:hypothetical protein